MPATQVEACCDWVAVRFEVAQHLVVLRKHALSSSTGTYRCRGEGALHIFPITLLSSVPNSMDF